VQRSRSESVAISLQLRRSPKVYPMACCVGRGGKWLVMLSYRAESGGRLAKGFRNRCVVDWRSYLYVKIKRGSRPCSSSKQEIYTRTSRAPLYATTAVYFETAASSLQNHVVRSACVAFSMPHLAKELQIQPIWPVRGSAQCCDQEL
jgi:hypothetical protein